MPGTAPTLGRQPDRNPWTLTEFTGWGCGGEKNGDQVQPGSELTRCNVQAAVSGPVHCQMSGTVHAHDGGRVKSIKDGIVKKVEQI